MSNKEVNVYSFNDECYVYLGDYKKLQQENQQLEHNWNELKSWLEEYFKGMTIEDIPKDDFYKKGMYRMNEYTLDKISELEEGGNNDNN